MFIDELTNGMYLCCDMVQPQLYCTYRAGLIKVALDRGEMNDRYRKLFAAVSTAAKEPGAAMMVHIEQDSDPVILADFLKKRSVDLTR